MRRVTIPWPKPDTRSRRPNLGCIAGAALLALVSRAGNAADPDYPRDVVEGSSACPAPRAVWAALGALVVIGRVEQRLRALPGGRPPVEVTDLGAAFRIRVGDRARDYEDAGRDCRNRAKLAAVFVALAVDSADDPQAPPVPKPPTKTPPEALLKTRPQAVPVAPPRQPPQAPLKTPAETTPETAPEATPETRPEVPAAPPPSVRATVIAQPAALTPRRHSLYLELGADGRVALGASSAAPGALAQLAWDRGRLELTSGARGSAPARATIGGVHVRQWRVAAELAARLRLGEDWPLSPFLELGAVAALLFERGSDLAATRTGKAAELGIVAGAGVRFLRRAWGSPFVLVEAELDPVPPTISAMPAGDIGRTPRVWVGAAAGVSVGLF